MNPIVRNIIAAVAGFVVGSAVNLTLVSLGPHLIPLPEGADVSDMEGLRQSMKLFRPANFLFPFLGHALGTLVGAFTAAKVAASHHRALAMGIGVFFLLGGITMVATVGGPVWFCAADIILAYIPMAWLGASLAEGRGETQSPAAQTN